MSDKSDSNDMDIQAVLATAEIFAGLTPEELTQVLACGEKVAFAPADMLIQAGRAGTAFYILLGGKVRVDLPLGGYVTQQGGKREARTSTVKLNTLTAGDCFGEYALLDGQPTSASIFGVEAWEVLRIGQAAFEGLVEREERVAKKLYENMLKILIRRLRKLNKEYHVFLTNY